MPLSPDPDEPRTVRLLDGTGVVVARLRVRQDEDETVAEILEASSDAPSVVRELRRELADARIEVTDAALSDALQRAGLPVRRAFTDMRHDLTDLRSAPLPDGWRLVEPAWDEELARGLAAAFDGHPGGGWTANDTGAVRGILERAEPVRSLAGASARVVDADGRSVGHVLVAGPVPWTADVCGWILNLGVAPSAQRRGAGRALLAHALAGTAAAGLPTLGLEVDDGGPGRGLYDAAGFRVRRRVRSHRFGDPAARVGE